MQFDIKDFRMRYPEMEPYIGNEYAKAQKNHCALLVIGESHYLPERSTIHKNCSTWYASDHTLLDQEERGWISTSEIITEEIPKDFPNRAHGIWKYGYRQINHCGPRFNDYRTLFNYTVFYNFYLRPADYGNTFKTLCNPYDNAVANCYFNTMVEQYQPNGIIFLSRLAFESCEGKETLSMTIAGAPHPTCYWWNKKCGKYGNRFGRDIIQDGVKGMDWSWAKSPINNGLN